MYQLVIPLSLAVGSRRHTRSQFRPCTTNGLLVVPSRGKKIQSPSSPSFGSLALWNNNNISASIGRNYLLEKMRNASEYFSFETAAAIDPGTQHRVYCTFESHIEI